MAPESFSLVNVYRMDELAKGRKVGSKGNKLTKLPIWSSLFLQRLITGGWKGTKVVTCCTTSDTITKPVHNNATVGCLFASFGAPQVAVYRNAAFQYGAVSGYPQRS